MVCACNFHIVDEETIFPAIASSDINSGIEGIGRDDSRYSSQVF